MLRALGIGDVCAAVPALRALRHAYPHEHLALATPGWLTPFIKLTGLVDRVVAVPEVSGGAWPADLRWPAWVHRPTLAVNLHGRGPQSHAAIRATRPQRLLAFACPAAGHFYGPQWTEEEHEVHRWCRLLRWYGLASDPADLSLPRAAVCPAVLAGHVPAGVVVLHPGAKAPGRRWPAARYASLARRLTGRGLPVVITGSPAEVPLARRIAYQANLPENAVLAGRTDTGALAALVAYAALVVSGDTGVGHLATAYHTPSVLIFGPTSPAIWGPPAGSHRHRVLWSGQPASTGLISRAAVIEAVDEVLRTARAGD